MSRQPRTRGASKYNRQHERCPYIHPIQKRPCWANKGHEGKCWISVASNTGNGVKVIYWQGDAQ